MGEEKTRQKRRARGNEERGVKQGVSDLSFGERVGVQRKKKRKEPQGVKRDGDKKNAPEKRLDVPPLPDEAPLEVNKTGRKSSGVVDVGGGVGFWSYSVKEEWCEGERKSMGASGGDKVRSAEVAVHLKKRKKKLPHRVLSFGFSGVGREKLLFVGFQKESKAQSYGEGSSEESPCE